MDNTARPEPVLVDNPLANAFRDGCDYERQSIGLPRTRIELESRRAVLDAEVQKLVLRLEFLRGQAYVIREALR